MTRIEQLYYLLFNYYKGQYDTESFCNQFVLIYSDGVDDVDANEHEKEFMERFCRLAERYSSYTEDQDLSPFFLNECSFLKNFEVIYDEFFKKQCEFESYLKLVEDGIIDGK